MGLAIKGQHHRDPCQSSAKVLSDNTVDMSSHSDKIDLDVHDLVTKINHVLQFAAYAFGRHHQPRIHVVWDKPHEQKTLLLFWNLEYAHDDSDALHYATHYKASLLRKSLYPYFTAQCVSYNDDLTEARAAIK